MKTIALCVIAALGVAHAAEPITIKGLAPGITKAQIEELHPGMTSRCRDVPGDPTTDEVCVSIGSSRADLPALATFAGVRAKYYAANLRNGTAHTILVAVESSDFASVEAAITERYGKPVERKLSTVKNRMGAEFDQVHTTWRRDDSVLIGRKRSFSVDEAGFQLTAESGIEDREKRRKEGAKASAKDM
jgi:hypothetical protein